MIWKLLNVSLKFYLICILLIFYLDPRVTAVPEDEVRPTSPTPPQLTITDANGREEVLAEGVGDFDYGNQDGEEIDLNDNDSNSSDDDRE